VESFKKQLTLAVLPTRFHHYRSSYFQKTNAL
jgi:hypothetical protein